MRRIYESRAVERNDDDPFVPGEDDQDEKSRSAFDWDAVSHAFMPRALRDRAIAVDVETDRAVYEPDEPVLLRITFENRLPFPVTLRTQSPVLWRWSVDDLPDASLVDDDPPDRPGMLTFARSERKRFTRRWPQTIRESESDWRPAATGTHALAAAVNVDDPTGRGLRAETEIRIER